MRFPTKDQEEKEEELIVEVMDLEENQELEEIFMEEAERGFALLDDAIEFKLKSFYPDGLIY